MQRRVVPPCCYDRGTSRDRIGNGDDEDPCASDARVKQYVLTGGITVQNRPAACPLTADCLRIEVDYDEPDSGALEDSRKVASVQPVTDDHDVIRQIAKLLVRQRRLGV